ncbi:unnamed protein product [Rotaria magnacalcarata]|uniref:Small integral membrane protein 14 n=2 Tax=Rotaria magnacalcarata TaxID=392030 RepID=A0A816YRW5_9BILA|nr:unnamed protein product [Rotaria magnacalcarata]
MIGGDIYRETICVYSIMDGSAVPGLPNTGGNTGMSNMYIMLAIWFAIALLLFLFRPRTLRNNRNTLGKPNNQDPHNNGQDPPAPEVQ